METIHWPRNGEFGGKPLLTGECLIFEFAGIRLCLSLEIADRGAFDPERKTYRDALSNLAQYEEHLQDFREEESRIRLLKEEKHFVSEMVRAMRMQAKQTSSQRATELLQELIQVEISLEFSLPLPTI